MMRILHWLECMARFVLDERINYKLSHLVLNLLAQKNDVGKKNVETLQQLKPHSYMYHINDPWTDFGRVSWSPSVSHGAHRICSLCRRACGLGD